jgi:hypothetical protein
LDFSSAIVVVGKRFEERESLGPDIIVVIYLIGHWNTSCLKGEPLFHSLLGTQ